MSDGTQQLYDAMIYAISHDCEVSFQYSPVCHGTKVTVRKLSDNKLVSFSRIASDREMLSTRAPGRILGQFVAEAHAEVTDEIAARG